MTLSLSFLAKSTVRRPDHLYSSDIISRVVSPQKETNLGRDVLSQMSIKTIYCSTVFQICVACTEPLC